MAKAKQGGTGKVTIPAVDVEQMLRVATELPPTFFVTLNKAKVLNDGALEATYAYSTEGAPPAPPQADTQ